MSTCRQTSRGNDRFRFNPLELAICGYSGSGKTTLAERLTARLAARYRVGYVKHSKAFELDREGKDTARLKAAGARQVLISSPQQYALQATGEIDPLIAPRYLIDADLVIAEGFKTTPLPKIAILGKDLDIADLEDVIAVVGPGEQPADLPNSLPYYNRDDLDGLTGFVSEWFQQQAQRPLYGLVLVGGRSTRMGTDKAMLDYHGKPQAVHACEQLSEVCEEVFISVRPDQNRPADELPSAAPALPDTFLDMGPMGGIMTALTARPGAGWLVLACDLPFVTGDTLRTLIDERNPFKAATAFRSRQDHGFPEPLCAIYEPKSLFAFTHSLALGYRCPRKVLINTDIETLNQDDPRWLDNVNHPDERAAARQRIQELTP